ncbi:MAG: hypothetical protein JKY23_00360 [Nitrospinaceae bacterium]|nr:hypothetical protein [Nitrospinaceae bacterium]
MDGASDLVQHAELPDCVGGRDLEPYHGETRHTGVAAVGLGRRLPCDATRTASGLGVSAGRPTGREALGTHVCQHHSRLAALHRDLHPRQL